jgi:hypothetical protein
VFSYGLRNTAQIVERHMAQRFCLPTTNDEFMGMADYIMESIHDLLVSDSESISNSASSQGATTPRANASWWRSLTTLVVRQP